MPAKAAAPVEAHGPGRLKPMHPSDEVRFGRLQHEVIVVAHQDIIMHAPTGALASLFKSRQKCPPILIVPINGLAPVTTVKNVVDGSWELNAYFT